MFGNARPPAPKQHDEDLLEDMCLRNDLHTATRMLKEEHSKDEYCTIKKASTVTLDLVSRVSMSLQLLAVLKLLYHVAPHL